MQCKIPKNKLYHIIMLWIIFKLVYNENVYLYLKLKYFMILCNGIIELDYGYLYIEQIVCL